MPTKQSTTNAKKKKKKKVTAGKFILLAMSMIVQRVAGELPANFIKLSKKLQSFTELITYI
jgi:hypothetical protein